jgi:hypothetical protein
VSWKTLVLSLGCAALLPGPLSAQTNNEIFEKMIGPKARMDPAITAEVLRSKPGTKFRYDTDGDGRTDTIYLIDNDERHSPARQPMLVKVVDEDGDMAATGEGDLDSDLYVVDWNGDGSIDRAVDYVDLDHDQDVDEEVQYRWHDDLRFQDDTWDALVYDGRAYSAFWAKDIGDDNRLTYERDYEYAQEATQWKSDFNGSEVDVYAYLYDVKANTFVPGWENPFCFYDDDGDSRADEAVRLTGSRGVCRNLRYSMDLDNDERGTQRHGYDLSITALGPIRYGEQDCERHALRGIPTGPVIAWDKARSLARAARWSKTELTFNENHDNIDPNPGGNPSERWEGVINTASDSFPQVGGPACGLFNKRYEVDSDNSGRFRLYRSPVDRRWHLFGAETGWIRTDYDYDGRSEMELRSEDTDGDGFFDLWRYDLDGDGKFEREYRLAGDRAALVPFDCDSLRAAYMGDLGRIVEDNQRLIEALKATLRELAPGFVADEVEGYFSNRLGKEYDRGAGLGAQIKSSLAGTRCYGDLIRERYVQRLLKAGTGRLDRLDEAMGSYVTGDYAQAAAILEGELLERAMRPWLEPYGGRFAIEIENPGERRLESRPFVLRLANVRRQFPDFNEQNYALTEASPRIDWRIVPSQVDDLDGDGRADELVWVRTLEPREKAKLWCYYTPRGASKPDHAARTDAAMDWDAGTLANIGWESDQAAYRFYYGQIEAFGKKGDRLILAGLKDHPSSYHSMQDWGMDVLHVGDASGLGGLSIWEDGHRLPLVNPGGKGKLKIEREIVARGPVRALARVEFSGLKGERGEYRVRLEMSAFAGNRCSRQDVTVWSPDGKEVTYGPGLQKLVHGDWYALKASGVLADWGFGAEGAGEIGLGVMYRPEEYVGFAEGALDRYVKLRAPSGQTRTHWIVGDWRKGFANPTAPSSRDWARRVEDVALQVRTPVAVRLLAN